MARRRANRKSRKSKKRFLPHIYFESKRPGRDSVLAAVRDIGRPGVNTAKEVKLLAFAQLADYADGKTVDHHGRTVRFTDRKWAGRTMVLKRLAAKYGGKKAVETIQKYKEKLKKAKSKREKERILLQAAKELGIDKSTAKSIMESVEQ